MTVRDLSEETVQSQPCEVSKGLEDISFVHDGGSGFGSGFGPQGNTESVNGLACTLTRLPAYHSFASMASSD